MSRGYYTIDLSIVHGIIFVLPCIILALFKLWTKIVAKSQAEIITRKLNEELVKLVQSEPTAAYIRNFTQSIIWGCEAMNLPDDGFESDSRPSDVKFKFLDCWTNDDDETWKKFPNHVLI